MYEFKIQQFGIYVLVEISKDELLIGYITWCGYKATRIDLVARLTVGLNLMQDLVWLNIRNYCGMVLDRETGTVLGSAVLFIPTDSKNRKSAWVTSVNTVESRCEVVIKDSKGEIQVAKLMLTSTTFGLAFFSVRTWQKTFALAFLSMVSGPASLPHRLYVDAERGDQVYVFGYPFKPSTSIH